MSGSIEYIYLPDDCCDRHECSQCGRPVFADLDRRSSHDEWIAAIQAHKTCDPDEYDEEDRP